MGRRRNEDKPGHARRKIQREGKRQRTAPGMADNNGAIDAKPAEEFIQNDRLFSGRIFAAFLARTKPESGPIDQNDAVASGQPLAYGDLHVLKVGSGAVEENDGQIIARVRVVSELNDVSAQAVNVDETAVRRMPQLNQPSGSQRDRGASQEDGGNDNQRG